MTQPKRKPKATKADDEGKPAKAKPKPRAAVPSVVKHAYVRRARRSR